MLDGLRPSEIILVHIRSLKVNSDQSWAVKFIQIYMLDGRMGWDWEGWLSIGHKSSKSTFGANKIIFLSIIVIFIDFFVSKSFVIPIILLIRMSPAAYHMALLQPGVPVYKELRNFLQLITHSQS